MSRLNGSHGYNNIKTNSYFTNNISIILELHMPLFYTYSYVNRHIYKDTW